LGSIKEREKKKRCTGGKRRREKIEDRDEDREKLGLRNITT